MATVTDPAASEWSINDPITQLRLWGCETAHQLPTTGEQPFIGTSNKCSIRLDDPAGQISNLHARLIQTKFGWGVRDLQSKNGIQLDGARRAEGVLQPGTELGIGGIVLVAESEQLIALRGFLSRLLGWSESNRPNVDRALRAVRLAAARRVPLLLSGDEELATLAQSLHIRTRGRYKPFVLCNHRRVTVEASVRSVANFKDARTALGAATGGSLCVLRHRMPCDMEEILEEMRVSMSRVQLILCAWERSLGRLESFLSCPIVIPDLASRGDEIDRVIYEYAMDAMDELAIPRPTFTEEDHAWVRAHSASKLTEIEKGTRRIVACRASKNIAVAATRLGMASISLSRWFQRRDSIGTIRFQSEPPAHA